MTAPLLDTHYHLDFLEDPRLRGRVLTALAGNDVTVVAQTLTPSAFVEQTDRAGTVGDPHPPAPLFSLGFHPWEITSEEQAADELEVFASALDRTRFIGEVGLDFVPRRLEQAPADLQVHVFRRVLELTSAAAGSDSGAPHVLSVHAVRSATEVVGMLEERTLPPGASVPVLHRFGGTSDDLTRLVRLGGCVSVHPTMLTTRRGRAFARQVPADRLLLETDLPVARVVADPPPATPLAELADSLAAEVVDALRGTLRTLSELRGCDMAPVLAENQHRLYAINPR